RPVAATGAACSCNDKLGCWCPPVNLCAKQGPCHATVTRCDGTFAQGPDHMTCFVCATPKNRFQRGGCNQRERSGNSAPAAAVRSQEHGIARHGPAQVVANTPQS